MKQLLFGAAYYYEYLPYKRLEKDIEMMKAAGINVVRIAESTWATYEPLEGQFDFSAVETVLDAMEEAGISVIVGTPTYAVPAWLVKKDPDVMRTDVKGRALYGARQIMDITNPTYRKYGERIIRRLMEVTAHRKCVIGFQIDNETKHYDTAGANVQAAFVEYLKERFYGDLEAVNQAFGLDYWSNRVGCWEDFPDTRGTINGSVGTVFAEFQRSLVTEFLHWQAEIIKEYKREDQFITHNLDYEWRGFSYGIQPQCNHFHVADQCLTMAGCDIYHRTQDELTGIEIGFGGDICRSLKQNNYLILETAAQGFPGWTPYKNQLRLQAFSHLASGAGGVMYWHWGSLHNAIETYWRGLLAQDFEENDTYNEAKTLGRDFAALSPVLHEMRKENKIAIMVSHESYSALEWFPVDGAQDTAAKNRYNDVFRWIYDALYKMNAECDIISPEHSRLSDYKMVIVPALYSAPERTLLALKRYVADGGYLIFTCKSGYTDENVKVFCDSQPHALTEVFGMSYNQFTFPKNVGLKEYKNAEVQVFMELLKPTTAQVLAGYDHYNWGGYAAVTRNTYGKGTAEYIGCMTDEATISELLRDALQDAGLWEPVNALSFPIIVRKGINHEGKKLWFYLNYTPEVQRADYVGTEGTIIMDGPGVADISISGGEKITLRPWSACIILENHVVLTHIHEAGKEKSV